MKTRTCLRAMIVSAILLALPLIAAAKTPIPGPGPDCHQDPQGCVHRMRLQLKQIKAYLVAHVGPGDPVEFNPQPDPPGDPDPWYRKANEAYFGLTQEFADLTSNQAEFPILRPSPQRREAFVAAVGEGQNQLAKLGQKNDRQEATNAFAALTASVNRIGEMAARK